MDYARALRSSTKRIAGSGYEIGALLGWFQSGKKGLARQNRKLEASIIATVLQWSRLCCSKSKRQGSIPG